MGVGEDETLGDAIAVTIIATGFDIEQNGIVNTEPKKIIHTLEDEQRSVHNRKKHGTRIRFECRENGFRLCKSCFDLMEDSTAPEAVVPVAGNEERQLSLK
jgi:cell division protein FtsZ